MALEQVVRASAVSKTIQDELHGDPRVSEDGLSGHHAGNSFDMTLPVHAGHSTAPTRDWTRPWGFAVVGLEAMSPLRGSGCRRFAFLGLTPQATYCRPSGARRVMKKERRAGWRASLR